MGNTNNVACATILAAPEFNHWGELLGWRVIKWHIGRQFKMPGCFCQELKRWEPHQRYFFMEFPSTDHYSAFDNAENWIRGAEKTGFLAGDGRDRICWQGMC